MINAAAAAYEAILTSIYTSRDDYTTSPSLHTGFNGIGVGCSYSMVDQHVAKTSSKSG